LQAIAQIGLAFTRDPYDAERYEMLRALAARIMAARTGTEARRIEALVAAESGYATPKIDVRAAVFDPTGRILMVREAVDDGRWTLPGGWADVNQTLAECAAREVAEESGYQARVVKLAAVWDRARQGHPPGPFSIAKLFFLCALTGGEFTEDKIPPDLSTGRVLPKQIARMFAHWRNPQLPTDFE
jgi:ADP-ribose pyrophosphatase YjhB (NUDIX family)